MNLNRITEFTVRLMLHHDIVCKPSMPTLLGRDLFAFNACNITSLEMWSLWQNATRYLIVHLALGCPPLLYSLA